MNKLALINAVLPILIKALPEDALLNGMDYLLDLAEEAIERSTTKVDDTLLLPVITLIRESFNIDPEGER